MGRCVGPDAQTLLHLAEQVRAIANPSRFPKRQEFTDDVGQLIDHFAKLPVELRMTIAAASAGCPLAAALAVLNTSTALIDFISKDKLQKSESSPISKVSVPLRPRVKRIVARWINIYNSNYLHSLESTEEEIQGEYINSLPVRQIQGLKFSLGCYGIQAVKLVYADGVESNWLGDETSGWIGEEYGDCVTELLLWRDV